MVAEFYTAFPTSLKNSFQNSILRVVRMNTVRLWVVGVDMQEGERFALGQNGHIYMQMSAKCVHTQYVVMMWA